MAWLDDEIAGRDFIAGDSLTIADITAICAFGIGRIARIKIPGRNSKTSRLGTHVCRIETALSRQDRSLNRVVPTAL